MSSKASARSTAVQAPRSQLAPHAAMPVPAAGELAEDGNAVLYRWAVTPAAASPEDAVGHADHDAEANLVIRIPPSAAGTLCITPPPVPPEGMEWGGWSRPAPGAARWYMGALTGPDSEDDPPAPPGRNRGQKRFSKSR